jgi:arthrofactin-type cyclic lipopeptide synthetase C
LASYSYKAFALPVPIHLFSAEEGPANAPYRGWDTVVPKGRVRLIPAAGSHFTMLASPNVEKLGKALFEAVQNAGLESIEPPEKLYAPAVRLQMGPGESEPLFCIPGAGASATSFIELASNIKTARPIYGFNWRGLDGELLPYTSVQSAATAYLQAQRELQRRGRIHLLGHSFGGWAALEMAIQMSEAGNAEDAIASVIVIDSEAPDDQEGVRREYDSVEAAMVWVNVVEQFLERPLEIKKSDLDHRDEAGRMEFVHRRLVAAGFFPRRSTPQILRGTWRACASSLRTCFHPRGMYQGPVHLILATDPALDEEGNRQRREQVVRGWQRWAPNLAWRQVSGNHMTILKPPYVVELASVIRSIIEEEKPLHFTAHS